MKNKNTLLGHAADNDGIEEYDNALPDWWLGLFVLSIIAAVIYVAEYSINERSQEGEYQAELAAALVMWPESESTGVLPTDDASIAEGAEIYKSTCAACHGEALEGKIGPSLVDAEWIHGGTADDVIKTISDGIPAKAMPAWGKILGPKKVNKVAAYVLAQGKP